MLTQKQFDMLTGNYRGISPIWAGLWDIPVNGEPGKVGVPYLIHPNFSNPQKDKILKGMEEIEEHSCIRY